MSIGSIYDAKELSQTFQPLLLLEFTFNDGSIYRASTHPLNLVQSNAKFAGVDWDGRVLNQDVGNTQAMSDLGVDITPQVTVMLADPDKSIYSVWEQELGFKGAILTIYIVMHDYGNGGTGAFSTDSPAPIKFIGTCGPSSSDQGVLTVSATSLLAFTQKQMPPQRIQQICSWSFPPTIDAQSAALTNPFSIFYQCGYSYGVSGGCGNPDPDSLGGTGSFTSCDLSFNSCVSRLGNRGSRFAQTGPSKPPIMADLAGNLTGRFGGYNYIPPQYTGRERSYLTGNWSDIINAANTAVYGDFMPLVYGTSWVNPLVMGIYGDGNYTYLEVAVCFGQINRIHNVVVNGIQVQQASPDANSGYRPDDDTIPSDATTTNYKNGYWTTINDGRRNGAPNPATGWSKQGDPYGSVASILIAVLQQVAPENSVPTVQILLDGVSVPVYTSPTDFSFQFSDNPAWILMAILILSGWNVQNMDIQSFIDAATYCDQVVLFDSQGGSYQNFYNESAAPPFHRFSCGFAVQTRMSFGDLVRGIRANMRGMIYFNFNTGLLTLLIKQTLGDQQPAPILGSNNVVAIESVDHAGVANSGYSAYSFNSSNIQKTQGGKSTLTVIQQPMQQTPNRTTLQFLNRENSYSQDSITVVDIEDVQRVGQEVVLSMPVIGIHTFDHARRVLNNWLAENYRGNGRLDYLGSAIGDTGGTLIFEFTTSVKGVHLVVGQIIDLTDPQFGFIQQLLRITKVKPSTNYETVTITAKFHNDNWYQDTYGQSEQPIYGPAQGLANVPFAWRPGYAQPMAGDATFDSTELSFDIYPFYSLAADGTGLASLQITGKIPVNSFPRNLSKPILEIVGQGASGGGYPTGSYYVAVCEKGPSVASLGGAITGSHLLYGTGGYVVGDTGNVVQVGGVGATYQVLSVDSVGRVLTYTLTAAGTGYYTQSNVATSRGGGQPGVGSGFILNIVAGSAGSIVAFNVGTAFNNVNYAVGDTGNLTNWGPVPGTGATYEVTAVDQFGGVVTLILTNSGINYPLADNVTTVKSGAQPGIGFGLEIDITAISGGPIASSTLAVINNRYEPGQTGDIVQSGASGGTYVVTSVDANGNPTGYVVTSTGQGYVVSSSVQTARGGSNPGQGSGFTIAIDSVSSTFQGTGLSATSKPVIVAVDPGEDALEAVVQAWPGSPSGYVAFVGTHATALSYQVDGTGTPQVIDLINNYNEGSWGPPDDAFAHHQFEARLIYIAGPFGAYLPQTYAPPLVSAPTGSVSASVQITTYENYGFYQDQLAGRVLTIYGIAVRGGNTNTPIPIANFEIAGNNVSTSGATTVYLSSGDPTTCVAGGPMISGDVIVVRFKLTFGSDTIGNYFEDSLLNDYALANLDDIRLIADVSDTTPIMVTLDLSDGSTFTYVDGDLVVVEGVVGTDSANGRFAVVNSNPAAAQFQLVNSSGNGDYIGGGSVGRQVGIVPNDQVGNLAFIVDGTGAGTYVTLTANTKSRFYINGNWPQQPDATSTIIIVSPDFAVVKPGVVISNAIREFVLTQGFDIQNYDKIPMLIQVSTRSKAGKASLPTLDPIREIFLIGNPLTAAPGVPGSPLFTVRVEEYATLTVNDFAVPQNAYQVNEANFLVPSVDESDVGLWAVGRASTTAALVNVQGGSLNSRFGTKFSAGDYVVWNDPPGYECDFISAIDSSGNATLVRQDPLAGPGTAFFGSPRQSHSLSRLYRLIPKIFTGALAQNMYGTSATPSGLPQQWTWAWPNRCVVAAVGQVAGLLGNSSLGTVNLAPGADPVKSFPGLGPAIRGGGLIPPGQAPGLRTLSGAAYINLSASGPLTVGQVADQRIQVQSWSSIRCVVATLLTPSSSAIVKVHVLWISPDFSQVGLIDTVLIPVGQLTNYSIADLPRNRQMPYHANGWVLPQSWPPNELPLIAGSPLVAGVLTLPIVPIDNSPNNLIFAPDGWIDFIVETPGNAAGLIINVQV